MYCDNTRAIAIAKDDGVTKGARHFRAKVHYLRETIKLDDVKIEKVDTDDNLADPFTKALAFPKHFELTRNIRILPASSFMHRTYNHIFEKSSDHSTSRPHMARAQATRPPHLDEQANNDIQ
nr:hypothetical protein [Tanacetum cinerariifolium]